MIHWNPSSIPRKWGRDVNIHPLAYRAILNIERLFSDCIFTTALYYAPQTLYMLTKGVYKQTNEFRNINQFSLRFPTQFSTLYPWWKKIYLISEVWGDLMTIWHSKSEGSCCNPYCIKQLWKSHALHFIHNSPSKSVSKPSFFKISNSLNLLISNSPFFNKPFFSPKTSVLFSDETRLSHVWRDMYLAWEVLSG